MGFEPPIDPKDDTNPSDPIDVNHEPPIGPDDTNPSKSQVMRAVNADDAEPIDVTNEPPVGPDDTNPSKSQVMRAVAADEPPIRPDDTGYAETVDPYDEPPISPDDTNPSIGVRTGELAQAVNNADAPLPLWRRFVGAASLLIALALTAGTIWLLLAPAPAAPMPTEQPTEAAAAPTTTVAPPTPIEAPTETEAETAAVAPELDTINLIPTLAPSQFEPFLSAPLTDNLTDGIQVVRNAYEPFTLIPDRPRGEVIQYVVEEGDTIGSIAEKFGLEQESVAWANDRNIINILPVGRSINIPPVDGVLIPRHTGDATIQDYANRYRIADPYMIIDSEYNRELNGLTPDSIPPSGAQVMIPGGQAEQINWNPTVVREGSGGNSSGEAGGASFITFAPNDPGSCGRVQNPGGGGFWSRPISNYTWMRGFTSFHTGVDLAAPIGTPVTAAQGGTVIFAGWNNWGYGYTVVLAHGPFTTLYGHLSTINVGCGQTVSAGQQIAGTGNSGNSSGPHLHFEIRFNDQPQDPTATIGF